MTIQTDAKKYDSLDGITLASQNFDALAGLVKARVDAGYSQGERLHEWIVLGKLFLDSCGNVLLITEIDPDFRATLPRVCDWASIRASVPQHVRFTCTMTALPASDDRCGQCGSGWDLGDIETALNLSGRWWHKECWRLALYERERQRVEGFFRDAGFDRYKLHPIQNQYHQFDTSGSVVPPWFRVATSFGQFIVGLRKRVYVIDWSQVGVHAIDFSGERTTQDDHSIHAWSDARVVHYLRMLRAAAEDNQQNTCVDRCPTGDTLAAHTELLCNCLSR